ncbi:MAG TPA: EamA family transporter [Candidatus Limnocylindria bacterium]|nr:EamA family transporter [Candidatus Limnocylindria bacterium]
MTERGPDRPTLAAYACLVTIAGTNFVAVRFSNAELAPFWGATLRFAIAGALFFAVMAIRRAAVPRGRALVGVLVYGTLGFGASYALLYWALQTVPAGLASVVIALVPLLTFLLAAAHGLEPFRMRGLVGGLIAVAGIAIVFAERLGGDASALGLLACLLGAACIAESSVAAKMFPRVDPSATNAVGMLAGLAILAPLVIVARETPALPARPETWAALGYLVTIGSIGLFALFLYVLRRWTATATSYILVLAPLVTIALGAALAGERVTAQFVAGAIVVALGVYIGALMRGRPAPAPAPRSP